jgi:hypothetical protein
MSHRCHSLIHALQQTQDVNVLIDLQLQPNRCTSATSDMAQGRHAKSQAVDRKIPATLSRARPRPTIYKIAHFIRKIRKLRRGRIEGN